jgi:hypothetical protein
MKLTASPKMKNTLLFLAALVFPFLALAIKVSSKNSYELYSNIIEYDGSIAVYILLFMIFHFWGSWLAISFTSFNNTLKGVFIIVFTFPMTWLMMLISFQAVCTYVVENCVMP